MKKKIFISTLFLGVCLIGINYLNAANNRVQIISENYASKQLSTDGMHITNMINTSKTDLVNGDVAIEIIIDNAKHTEIFYVIDNGKTMSSIKENIIDSIKTNAIELEKLENIEQGIATTTNGILQLIPLDSENIELQLNLQKQNTPSTTTDGEIFTSINNTIKNYSTTSNNKVMVITLSSIPTLTPDELSTYRNTIDQYINSGIKMIVYGIDLSTNDTSYFNNIFANATKYLINSNNLNEITFATNIMASLPQEKPVISTTVSFDKYILSNFDIKNVTTDYGAAMYDKDSKTVIWAVGDIKSNDTVKLTYTLSLKKAVDESIIENIILRTNRQIVVTQTGIKIGTYPADNQIDDQVCSPTIKVLKEAIDNPKTGVANYIIFGSCMLAIAAITIIILNNKKEFNRI